MAYISLYRKYRSQSFAEVSGQSHVTRTLGNAISAGRVGHAYLFCGPRGTGKTSVARLLAKCLNCAEAPTLEPCNTCPSCVEINAGITGASFNVQEFDAASKRSIDDIRHLRDTIGTGKWGPADEKKGRKVVIIDEVHMLTTEAFNALLKTLEEPPEHVLFVLATTDVHKVPATIVSRCQRFDFHRGSLEEIAARLQFVAEQEGVAIEDAAIERVARGAGGSWRDALSLLEQVFAYAGERVTVSDVTTVLGTVDEEDLGHLAGAVAAGDGAEVFAVVERLISDGRDIRQLTRDLTEYVRQLLLVAVGAAAPAGVTPEQQGLARAFGVGRLVSALEVLSATEREFRESDQLRLILEVALVRVAHLAGAPGAVPVTPVAEAQVAHGNGGAALREQPRPREGAHVREEASVREEPSVPVLEERAAPQLTNGPTAAPRTSRPAPVDTRAEVASDEPAAPPVDASGAQDPAPAVDLATVLRRWGVLVEELRRRRRNSTAALVEDAVPQRMDGGTVVLGFEFETHVQVLQRSDNRKWLAEAAVAVFQAPLEFIGEARGTSGPTAVASKRPAPPPQRPAPNVERPPAASENGAETGDNSRLVHEVIEMFDGKIIEDDPL